MKSGLPVAFAAVYGAQYLSEYGSEAVRNISNCTMMTSNHYSNAVTPRHP